MSQSDGSLSLIRLQDGIMTIVENWHAHDYEPWIAAWNYWDTNVLFSGNLSSSLTTSSGLHIEMILFAGGDDLRMKGWDVRQGFDCPIFENRR